MLDLFVRRSRQQAIRLLQVIRVGGSNVRNLRKKASKMGVNGRYIANRGSFRAIWTALEGKKCKKSGSL